MTYEELFLRKIARFIEKKNLMTQDGKYIVALSGGADSTALLMVLRKLGYDIHAAHCNFHLRGDESDRDELFCVELCKANGIALHRAHFDTKEYAAGHKVSIEMAARDLRYSYFNQLKNDISATAICVAHHSDDSAETVLLNLIRGTGLRGLAGIQPVNNGIVRPLLCVTHNEITTFLNEIKQDYVTDSSNLINDVSRNKIRLDIIPLMQGINPSVGSSISRTAERVAEALKLFDKALEVSASEVLSKSDDSTVVSIGRLRQQPAPEYTLYHILKNYAFTPDRIKEIYGNIDARTGTEYASRTHQLLFDRDKIIIEALDETGEICVKMPEEGVYVVRKDMKLKVECIENTPAFVVSHDKNVGCFDASFATFPLVVRTVKQGDRFVPFGMTGSKLVSDYLTDCKMSLFRKRRQLMLTDSAGRSLWLVGERPDNRARVTGKTHRIIRVTIV